MNNNKKINRKSSVILILLYILIITLFTFFGKMIRDFNSHYVTVMSPVMYTFPDGYISMAVLSNTCFSTNDEGEAIAFIIEEKSDTGEKAYFAKEIKVILGKSDDKCTEIIKAPTFSVMFILSYNLNINDGDRVVINNITDIP